jgi:hypothetical protein
VSFKMIGGDFPNMDIQTLFGKLYLYPVRSFWAGRPDIGTIDLRGQIKQVEIVTESNKKNIMSAVGWGVAAGVVLGPIGALAGVLAGGRRQEVCFACVLSDGRRFIATADAKLYQLFVAEQMKTQRPRPATSATSSTAGLIRPAPESSLCSGCGKYSPPPSHFCPNCGQAFAS